ncbi:MAG: urease accessory protein UreD [Hyphomicrobiales bacterium]
MDGLALLHRERNAGRLQLRMERQGIAVLREAGASKCRVPQGSREAILINTGGGLAGGDHIEIEAHAGERARLDLTSQAAERVYRTLGPTADVSITLSAGQRADLRWLPQETILFEGASLVRRIDVTLAADATFLAVEAMIFGRHAMGESLRQLRIEDRWQVRQAGRLVHVEAFGLGPEWPQGAAMMGSNAAMASVLWIAPQAAARLDAVRAAAGPHCGVSAWNGKLIARLLARDGLALRKSLLAVLSACVAPEALPKCWSF